MTIDQLEFSAAALKGIQDGLAPRSDSALAHLRFEVAVGADFTAAALAEDHIVVSDILGPT
jgi:hypothetical protein